jgi:Cdc6-like AAA superfamily ATPase
MIAFRLQQLSFDAYTADAVLEILEKRIGAINDCYRLFDRSALQLVAKKAATSGDVRFALHVCW